MKIIAILLLLAGLVGLGLGGYEYFDSYQGNREMAQTHLAKVESLRSQGAGSARTLEEVNKYLRYAAEANSAADSAFTRVLMYCLGGLAAAGVGAALMMSSRRRGAAGGGQPVPSAS